MNKLSEMLLGELKALAESRVWTDDDEFCIADYAGGNFDDAFYGGQQCGETQLARRVLHDLGVEFTVEEGL